MSERSPCVVGILYVLSPFSYVVSGFSRTVAVRLKQLGEPSCS